MQLSRIQHRSIAINGVNIFYPNTGPRDAPVLLLLHGFPASSRQYFRLMERLSDRLRVIAWGRNDPLFPEPGAHAYLRDLPQAELHLFGTGYFALEEHVDEIAALIRKFIARSDKR